MAISFRGNALLSRLKALLTIQRFNHTLAESGVQAEVYADMGSDSVLEHGQIDMSKWRKLDSRTLGITRSKISSPSWIVLKVLQSAGFEAYLVGGCVRDLILNKVPKDFDVITTAALKQIRKEFHRCEIVGRRFPICMVHVKGSVVEVSSFETVAENAKEKEEFLFSQMPRGCDIKDFVRWRDCMHRDFTINSLFFDPFMNKIYDYASGMMDLRSLKLRTLIPAQLSFEEDCARILRGLRIAARLGLSFSKETEIAIHKFSSSITSLAKSRLMMELNYMFSYGAAEPSLCLLQRFDLLEILLPFHAAYLAQQACKQSCKSSMMLMKIFFNLDKLITCDHPSDSSLWVGLLAFHLALVNNPQDALVVWTFASVLYHGSWNEGVKFAREHAQGPTSFIPEVSEACNFMSDDELAERVAQLASVAQDSIGALTETDSLLQSMSRFPGLPCSGLVFISKKTGKDAAQLFKVLVQDVKSHKKRRSCFNIDHGLLGKGNVHETRFVLGKIIMDTMSSGVVRGSKVDKEEKVHLHTFDPECKVEVSGEKCNLAPSDFEIHHIVDKKVKKHTLSPSNAETELLQERAKKQKLIGKKYNLSDDGRIMKQKAVVNSETKKIANQKQEMLENNECPEVTKKHQKVVKKKNGRVSQNEITQKQQNMGHLPLEEIIMTRAEKDKCRLQPQKVTEETKPIFENEKCKERFEKHLKAVKGTHNESQEEVSNSLLSSVERSFLPQDRIKQQEAVVENKKRPFPRGRVITENNEKHKQDVTKEQHSRPVLSSLFR